MKLTKLLPLFVLLVGFSANAQKVSSKYISQFFPIWNVTLGKTTLNDLQKSGYSIDGNCCIISNYFFYDDNEDGIIDNVRINSDDIPEKWYTKLGIDQRISYAQLINKLLSMGYIIIRRTEPTVKQYEGKDCLSAKVKMLSRDKKLLITLDFDYGQHGSTIYSPSTLYDITFDLDFDLEFESSYDIY